MVQREAARRVRRQALRTGQDLRDLRLDAGVSLRELSAVTGLHPSHIARIEAAQNQASIEALTLIGVALGADLSLRYFAGTGPRIHDRFQAPMIEELLRVLDERWTARLEVPIPRPGRGVVDLLMEDRASPTTVVGEAQSEFRRVEEQLRWLAEKAQAIESPDRAVSRLLILRSTVATREISRRYRSILSTAYPARTTDVVDALTGASPWPGPGVVWMRLDGGEAHLLPHPPRGVPVGR